MNDYKCDECNKPAKYNVQQTWITYTIDDDGNFTEKDREANGDNNFYCEEHYQLSN